MVLCSSGTALLCSLAVLVCLPRSACPAETCSWGHAQGLLLVCVHCTCRGRQGKLPQFLFALGLGLPEAGHSFVLAFCSLFLGSSVIFGLKGYVAERKGEREEMQDAHVILNDITEECNPPSSLM